jgi:hypothetical protein
MKSKQIGMSCKNTRFIKRGLTPDETRRMNAINAADKERWKHLLSLNKWKPQPN